MLNYALCVAIHFGIDVFLDDQGCLVGLDDLF